jgi:transposase
MGKEVPIPRKETCAMEERLKLMLEWNEEETSVSELSRCYGVSRKTAYKWRARYQREGVAGLLDQSRAPHRHPQGLSEAVVASVLELRHKRLTWGPKKIRAYLGRHRPEVRWPAESSIGELLQREGLVVSRRKRLRAPPRTAPLCRMWGSERCVVHRSEGLVPLWRREAVRSLDVVGCV